jgi:hypothetical protein
MHVGWMDECVFNGDERRRRLYIYEVDSLHVSFGSSPPFCLCVCVCVRQSLYAFSLFLSSSDAGRQRRTTEKKIDKSLETEIETLGETD